MLIEIVPSQAADTSATNASIAGSSSIINPVTPPPATSAARDATPFVPTAVRDATPVVPPAGNSPSPPPAPSNPNEQAMDIDPPQEEQQPAGPLPPVGEDLGGTVSPMRIPGKRDVEIFTSSQLTTPPSSSPDIELSAHLHKKIRLTPLAEDETDLSPLTSIDPSRANTDKDDILEFDDDDDKADDQDKGLRDDIVPDDEGVARTSTDEDEDVDEDDDDEDEEAPQSRDKGKGRADAAQRSSTTSAAGGSRLGLGRASASLVGGFSALPARGGRVTRSGKSLEK